jgi:hypothetical protein
MENLEKNKERHRFYSGRNTDHRIPGIGEIKARLSEKPYIKAIEKLRKMDEVQQPRKKLKLMDEVNELLISWINEFWNNLDIDEHQLVIAADQMILIYLYIVTRARVVELFAHIRYIHEFITAEVRKSPLGFLLATYEHSLHTLLENEKKSLEPSWRKSNFIDLSIGKGMILRSTYKQDDSDIRGTFIPSDLYAPKQDAFVEFSFDNIAMGRSRDN